MTRSNVAGKGHYSQERVERTRGGQYCGDGAGRDRLALELTWSRCSVQPSGQELRLPVSPAGRPFHRAAQTESSAHQRAPGKRSMSPRAVE